jgi:PKHD-type hydroxylase
VQPLEITGVFSREECETIVASTLAGPSNDAGLVRGIRSEDTRRSRISWLDEEGEAAWVFRRLLDTFADANREHFDFVLEEFAERMQVAWYGANENCFFDWHVDVGHGVTASRRKLTMVVQLSDDTSYEGGHLETNADGIVRQASRLIGSVLLLPSFVLHRVAPVTHGERYSLALWSHGPAFR